MEAMKYLKKRKEDKNLFDEMPIEDYLDKEDVFLYKDGTYTDFFQINAKDLITSDTDEIEMDCFKWAKFFKTYASDIKIIALKYPCNTQKQQRYWNKKIEYNKNPVFKEMLIKKRDELIWREKHTATREFYLQVFTETLDEIKEARDYIDATLVLGQHGLVKIINKEKKVKVWFKLNNKNSMLF